MTYALLSQLVANATAELDTIKKSRKALEIAVMRVQPLLNKYITEGHAKSDTEFKVCTLGPSCCKRGGIELLAEMKKLAEAHPEASVVESECLRRCGRGPNVEVAGIVYTQMNAERARELIDSQLKKQALNVDLLVNDEFAAESVNCEEKRCRLDLEIGKARATLASLGAQIQALDANLSPEPHQKVLDQVLLILAMKSHSALRPEIEEAELLLKRVVPLNAFVDRIYAMEKSDWEKAR